eukprot:82207_1
MTNNSPITPITPSESSTDLSFMMDESQYNEEVARIFKKLGYETGIKISDTLQGSIWRISKTNHKSAQQDTSILKVTSKFLQKHKKASFNGQTYNVKEDIISEQNILKFLTEQKDCSDTIVKYKWFFTTNTDLYLHMEDGGDSIFDFIKKAHRLIHNGNLDVNHWKQISKIIFKQMVESVCYIHSKRICHFDISLENFVINDVQCAIKHYSEKKWKIQFVPHSIKVKLCDFGVAEKFENANDLSSNKWCGKSQYQSPEIRNKIKIFDAKKNDTFCLGVCLFALCVGCFPWNVASVTDNNFTYVMNHSIAELLAHWNFVDVVDQDLLVIMDFLLQYEENRIDLLKVKHVIDQIKI